MYITKKMLEHCGYTVCCATDLSKVWKMMKYMNPDAIVLDNEIPDIYGFDYCRELRKKSSVPIMFISASRDDEIPAIVAGADDFMRKPLDYEILKARISAMLKKGAGEAKHQNGRGISRKYIMDDEVRFSNAPRQRQAYARRAAGLHRGKKNKVAMCISMGTALACFALAAMTVAGPCGTPRV